MKTEYYLLLVFKISTKISDVLRENQESITYYWNVLLANSKGE